MFFEISASFGEFLLFSDDPIYLGDIIASPNTKLALISKNNLLTLLKDQIILQNYLHMLSKRSMANQEKIKIYSQNNIEDRILFYLFSLCYISTILPDRWRDDISFIIQRAGIEGMIFSKYGV